MILIILNNTNINNLKVTILLINIFDVILIMDGLDGVSIKICKKKYTYFF